MDSPDGSIGRAGLRAFLKLVVLLIVIGVGAWLALRNGPNPSPAQVPPATTPDPPAPEPAASLLRERPDLRLSAVLDLKREDREALATGSLRFSAVTESDGTGDGVRDMFVILVSRDRPVFNLVWYRGTPRGYAPEPTWILRDANEPLMGVQVADRRLVPLFCLACDSNPVFRWSGQAFEIGLRFAGEESCVSDGTVFFEKPDAQSRVRHRSSGPELVRVLEVGARASDFSRWHKVTLQVGGESIAAFIDGRQFIDGPGC